MDKYTLTLEGRARFRRMRIDPDIEISKTEGYGIINYLYENGTGTVEEIINYTGLSWGQVTNRISNLIYHGYVEELDKK